MTRLKTGLIASAIAVAAGGLLLAAPMLAVAGGFMGHGRHGGFGGHGGNFMRGHMLEHISDELDLTADQREQIEGIFDAAHDQARERRDEMHAAHEQGMALLMAESYDAAAVETFADEQSANIADMIVLGAQTIHNAKSVLTPEQLEKLKELTEEHAAKRGRRHHGWHGSSDE